MTLKQIHEWLNEESLKRICSDILDIHKPVYFSNIYVSPETLEDIRKWAVDDLLRQTSKEFYASDS